MIALEVGNGIELNPQLEREVPAGSKLIYIADERIESFDCKVFNKAS